MSEKKANKTSENIGMVKLLGPKSDSKKDVEEWKRREGRKQRMISRALRED